MKHLYPFVAAALAMSSIGYGAPPAPAAKVGLDGLTDFESAEACIFTPQSSALFEAIGSYEPDQPQSILLPDGTTVKPQASRTKPDDRTTVITKTLAAPAGTIWNGLRLTAVQTRSIELEEADGSWYRELIFADTPAQVQSALQSKLNAAIPIAREYRALPEDQHPCGGAIQIDGVAGGSKISCSWGC
ncbi:hypothetical protein [Sphingosinicella sp. BN140058]|uniref:hypothetical protein n=1 Tax=Sphingosinicella sp. BN140058 TaxID=1892855 RepID=UPI00101379B6|nr:hypothetical protein [Sphingosinicella sp. BN140058]QAY80186.1 hypothetical protein ETR14_26445 [Sphingosinicella sp. BN140058]